MVGSEAETITPEYVPEYDPLVVRLIDSLRAMTREQLRQELVDQFEHGMWRFQTARSLKWMAQCLKATETGKTEAAHRLNTNHATPGRWIRGEQDPPFKEFQRFYVLFAVPSQLGQPLAAEAVLNLGGFCHATAFARSLLKGDPFDQDAEAPLTPEALLCLFHYFTSDGPMEHLVGHRPERTERFLKETLAAVAETIPAPAHSVKSVGDVAQVILDWGQAWVVCLRLLAEDGLGLEKYAISSKRKLEIPRQEAARAGRRR